MQDLITPDDFPSCYPIFAKSFPPDEIRPYDEQAALLFNPYYRLYAKKDGKTVQSLLAVYSFPELTFIEHFATDPALRGKGIGSTFLTELLSSSDLPVCLEVERPENDISIRRIAMYERLGFFLNKYDYIQPSISKGRRPVALYIMSYPSALNEEQYLAVRNRLYRDVYNVKEVR